MTRDKFLKRRRELTKLCKVVAHKRHLRLKLSKRELRMVDDLKQGGLAYWGAPGKALPRHRHGAFYSMFIVK